MPQVYNPKTELDPRKVPLEGFALFEASAGTGKTHTLTTLYLRLLLERELKVENILVVTFTNAAVAELRQRLRERIGTMLRAVEGEHVSDKEIASLAEARGAETRARDRVLLQDAWYNFDLAAVLTIHAFCQRMLSQHAFAGGLRFESTIVPDANQALDSAVTAYWLGVIERSPEWVHPLLEEATQGKSKHSAPSLFRPEARLWLKEVVRATLRFPELEIVWPEEKRSRDRAWKRYLCEGLTFVLRELKREKERQGVRSFDDLLRELWEALQSPRGRELAAAIRAQFPAALIDEFQDTDPLQYEIFRAVYAEAHQASTLSSPLSKTRAVRGTPCSSENTCWFVIGDPKQAIYGFRGADVFAYLSAKREAKKQFTLGWNYRSAPELVAAINFLFARVPQPFLIEGIPFEAAKPARAATGNPRAGLDIVLVPEPDGVSMTRSWGKSNVPPMVAAEIENLVHSRLEFGDHRVDYSSIAVLCRTNEQAASMQKALRERGIPSALESEFSVFDSLEAWELESILRALLTPTNQGYVRTAIATTLLGAGASEISLFDAHEDVVDLWSLRFAAWADIWRQNGFMAALEAIFQDCQVLPRVLARVDGERYLTNVRHLAELIHRASVAERLRPEEALRWLSQMRAVPEARLSDVGLGEAAQLHLESDEHAVKLVTIHKSKGLQYPVVICPFLWDEPAPRHDKVAVTVFHDANTYKPKLDVCRPQTPSSTEQIIHERRAEGRRLLYVALTRAQYLCMVFWGPFSGIENSPLAELLHPGLFSDGAKRAYDQKRNADLESLMRQSLAELENEANGVIRVRGPVARKSKAEEPQMSSSSALACARATRSFAGARWGVKSFSALLAEEPGSLPLPMAEGVDYDRAADSLEAEREGLVENPVPLANLPAGARTGQWLHWLLENLDFALGIDAQRELVEQAWQSLCLAVPAQKAPPVSLDELTNALEEFLTTPLPPIGIRLRDVARERCVPELGFLLPVLPSRKGSGNGTQGVRPEHLATLLARQARSDTVRNYAQQLGLLPFPEWQGFLKGYIDLLFEHGGRWYVVDYKSNDLGPRPQDYRKERLAEAMAEHHYVLQYHLYTVAAHRFLRQCLPHYDYEQHFGGVLYLFVRGISPRYPQGNGVFFDCPPQELVVALSRLFEGKGTV